MLYGTNKICCKLTKFLIVAVKHNNSILIYSLWWLHVSVILDHLQANLERLKVQSLHIYVLWDPILHKYELILP